MAETVIVTVKQPGGRDARDLELPTHVPVATLGPLIVQALGWSSAGNERDGLEFTFKVEDGGITVRPNETLESAGVLTGDVITLQTTRIRATRDNGTGPLLEAKPPCLVSNTGKVFRLLGKGKRNLIGRKDLSKDIMPEVDLTSIDSKYKTISSRMHAQIIQQNGEYFLQVLEPTNDMFINGLKVEHGERVKLRNDDELQFGKGGVELIARLL